MSQCRCKGPNRNQGGQRIEFSATLSLRAGRVIVKALIELLRWAYEFGAADARERPEQRAGVGFFRGYRPPRHSFSGPITICFECPFIVGVHEGAQRIPFLVGSQHDVISLLRNRDEAVDRALMVGCELLGKRVTDQCDRFVQPECGFRITYLEASAIALRFQPGAEIPEIEARFCFALLQFLGNQRRGTVLQVSPRA